MKFIVTYSNFMEKPAPKEFDRVNYYLDHYKNLSPDNFSIERRGDEIVIRIPS
jgi:hypothetical protein